MLYPASDDITETPDHLFYSFRITKSQIDKYFHDYFEGFDVDWREIIFKGAKCNDVKLRCFLNTEITLFLHFIYTSRCMKKLPSYTGLLYHISIIKKFMISSSSRYKGVINYMVEKKRGSFLNHLKILENLPG